MISGIDEAGRGPVIGPLVVAGVLFKNDLELVKLKVRDSKKIAPNRRIELAEIIKQIAIKYEVLAITASDIDDMRRVITLNEIEVNAFGKIIGKLKPDICYVDAADVNEMRFAKDISSKLSFHPKIISKHKADDRYPVVGAASIIAKTIRDEHIQRIENQLRKRLDIPIGSGYPADPVTKKFLKTWFETYNELPPYVRRSWKTAQKLIKNSKIKTLDDY